MTGYAIKFHTSVEILRAARALISSPENWLQGTFAQNDFGVGVCSGDVTAVCFCSQGAINYFKYEADYDAVKKATSTLSRNMDGSIFLFNDNHTHAEVLAAWDKAIAELETP